MTIRTQLENSRILTAILSRLLAGYVWVCFRTTRWQINGLNELAEELKNGPVIYVLWHERVMFGASAWPRKRARLYTLMDPSPIGRVGSKTQALLGMTPISMHEKSSNFAAARRVLQTLGQGHSIGIAADGPRGPARNAKQAALEWARATGRPVYLFAWRARRARRLSTWDRLIVPVPFSSGAYVFRRWNTDVPRKLDPAGYGALRANLTAQLDIVSAEADKLAGIAPDA